MSQTVFAIGGTMEPILILAAVAGAFFVFLRALNFLGRKTAEKMERPKTPSSPTSGRFYSEQESTGDRLYLMLVNAWEESGQPENRSIVKDAYATDGTFRIQVLGRAWEKPLLTLVVDYRKPKHQIVSATSNFLDLGEEGHKFYPAQSFLWIKVYNRRLFPTPVAR